MPFNLFELQEDTQQQEESSLWWAVDNYPSYLQQGYEALSNVGLGAFGPVKNVLDSWDQWNSQPSTPPNNEFNLFTLQADQPKSPTFDTTPQQIGGSYQSPFQTIPSEPSRFNLSDLYPDVIPKNDPVLFQPTTGAILNLNQLTPDTSYSPFNLPSETQPSLNRLQQDIVTGGSSFEQLMDIINTPLQAGFGAMMTKEGIDPWEGARAGIRANVSGQEFVPFLSGDPMTDPSTILTDPTGQALGKILTEQSSALGSEVLLDPLNLVGIGGVEPIGKGLTNLGQLSFDILRPIGRTLGKIPTPTGMANAFDAKNVGQLFSRTFDRTPSELTTMSILDDGANAKAYGTIDIMKDAGKRAEVIKPLVEKYGYFPEYLDRTLDDLIEAKVPPQSIEYGPRDPMPFVKAAPEGYQFNDPIGLSDSPRIELTNVPIVRGQSTTGVFEYNPKTKSSFANIVGDIFGEETSAVGMPGRNKVVSFLTPEKPLYVETTEGALIRTGLAEYALPKLFNPEVAKSIWRSDTFAHGVAESMGIPEDEIAKLLQKPIQLRDRIVSERASELGYDSIFAISPSGKHGEVAILDPNKVPRALPDSIPLPPQYQPMINRIKEMDQFSNVPREVIEKGLELKKLRNARFTEMAEKGMPTPELQDISIDYMLHMRTEEATDRLKTLFPDWFDKRGRLINARSSSAMARQWREIGLNEINELGREKAIPGLEGQYFKKFLEDDPIKLEAFRQLRDLHLETDIKTLFTADSLLGRDKGTPGTEDWIQLAIARSEDPQHLNLKQAFLNRVYEPEVVKHLNASIMLGATPEAEMKLLEYYDNLRNVWAASTLNLSPATMSRNTAGSIYNNALFGVKIKRYENARDIQAYINAVNDGHMPILREVTLNGKPRKVEEIIEEMRDLGVTGGGFATTEGHRMTQDYMGGFDPINIPLIGKPLKGGRRANMLIEDNARIAHYLEALDRGMNPLEAAQSVKKYLFDYVTGLTQFEKKVMRRIFPFYAFTRFNMPLQVQSIFGLTERTMPLVRLSELIAVSRDNETASELNGKLSKMTPQYLKEQVGIPVRKSESGIYQFFMLGGWLTAADLETLTSAKGPLKKLASMLTPFIKEIAEQAPGIGQEGPQGHDWFYNKPIADYPGQTGRFIGIEMNKRYIKLIKNVRLLGDLDRIVKGYYEDPTSLTTTQKTILQKMMSYFFGISTQNVDMRFQKKRWIYEYQDMMKQYRSAVRKGDKGNAERLKQMLKEKRGNQ